MGPRMNTRYTFPQSHLDINSAGVNEAEVAMVYKLPHSPEFGCTLSASAARCALDERVEFCHPLPDVHGQIGIDIIIVFNSVRRPSASLHHPIPQLITVGL